MAGGVEEDPECGAGLVLVLGGTELDDSGLGSVEVVDHDVDVHLLGHLLAGPVGSSVALDPLEADALVAVGGPDLGPTGVGADGPAEELTVELGRLGRIGAVEDDGGEACDCHTANRTRANPDAFRPVTQNPSAQIDVYVLSDGSGDIGVTVSGGFDFDGRGTATFDPSSGVDQGSVVITGTGSEPDDSAPVHDFTVEADIQSC